MIGNQKRKKISVRDGKLRVMLNILHATFSEKNKGGVENSGEGKTYRKT